MAELTPKERLSPSLLDRLTDDEPERATEPRESRVLSPVRLRECVRRDLTWLFNTTHMQSLQNLDELPLVARSVLNYGIPDLAGRTASSLDTVELEQMIRQAIVNFEPRLDRNSLKVRPVVDQRQMSQNALAFDVEAELWAQPLPLRLFLRTAVDLEAGNVEVTDQGDKGGS
ncbi:MAG TPA: type VI secretion system baseplate subunit TssE [Polyangia bacterium]|jgi:type VI secretion system lysozyme-related protein|nr:type VI secretion system baseplate subunit TssE [Polyangia bacterium]